MAVRKRHPWTEDEYLAFERDSLNCHEFLDGDIYDVAGTSEAMSASSLAKKFWGRTTHTPRPTCLATHRI